MLGGQFRADVTPWGSVVPWDGSPELAWHVAADDRWHSPADEVAVRQIRVGGAPVFETRVRVPGGDAVQRVWSVADGGGRTLVEVTNDSPLPIACAFTRSDILTNRPPTDVPIEGIELPPSTIVLPIGHRTSVTVALAHGVGGAGQLPVGSPTSDATVRGWVSRSENASRLGLPDERDAERLVVARSDILLLGAPSEDDDPVGHLLAVAELVRMGELSGASLDDEVPHVAAAVGMVAREPGWDVDAALDAALLVLARADERRAVTDVRRIIAGRGGVLIPAPDDDLAGPRTVAMIERRLACRGELLPAGIPSSWLGVNVEAHGIPVGPTSTTSFALRWHGENAAVLWEVEGDPVAFSAPAVDPTWRTAEPSGEALWRLPTPG